MLELYPLLIHCPKDFDKISQIYTKYGITYNTYHGWTRSNKEALAYCFKHHSTAVLRKQEHEFKKSIVSSNNNLLHATKEVARSGILNDWDSIVEDTSFRDVLDHYVKERNQMRR